MQRFSFSNGAAIVMVLVSVPRTSVAGYVVMTLTYQWLGRPPTGGDLTVRHTRSLLQANVSF